MTYQAVSVFHAVLADGSERTVLKGEWFPDDHELVLRDLDDSGGREPGQLFKKVELR